MAAVNEDPTKELPGSSPFEQRMLAEFGALRSEVAEVRVQQMAMARHVVALVQRLTSLEERLRSLEERVDSRLKETRPNWAAVQAQIEKLDEKFNLFIRDLYDVRGDLGLHDKRLGVLERRVLS
jgi:chromosome segregation ATPase